MDSVTWQIGILIILIAVNALFAGTEAAIISMNDNKLDKMASEGNRRAMRLQKLTSQPSKFLAADAFSDIIVQKLVDAGAGIPASTLNGITVVAITIVLS